MKRRFISSFLFLLLGLSVLTKPISAQDTVTCPITISLLTCSPGEELYSSFGHSALRVVNSENGKDIVFNYGTFDFDDPDFYSKFVKGKLLYFVSVDSYPGFMEEYRYFKRGVIEQVLNLTCDEKQQLLYALYENAREENKYYRYDFTYDNCTTRLRDMLEKTAKDSIQPGNMLPYEGVTFRNLIHEYLEKGNQHWSELGIDILLGAPLDKKITNREAMFLPDYLMKSFDSATIGNRPLVSFKRTLLPYLPPSPAGSTLKPVVIFSLLFLIVLLASFSPSKKIKKTIKFFDAFLIGFSGLLGILLLFMWWGTDHIMCRNNWNLVWAFPLNAIMVFFILSPYAIVRNYFKTLFFLYGILLLTWVILPQHLNIALLPVVAILCLRAYFISQKGYHGK